MIAPRPLSSEQVDRNCCQLWNYAGDRFRADDQGNLVGFRSWNVFRRSIFWIKDWKNNGGETEKVHEAVKDTLAGISKDMQPTDGGIPICYFITAKKSLFGGVHQFGHTYKELADLLNNGVKQFFPKMGETDRNEVCRRAQMIGQDFDRISQLINLEKSALLKSVCQSMVNFKPSRDLEHKRVYVEYSAYLHGSTEARKDLEKQYPEIVGNFQRVR